MQSKPCLFISFPCRREVWSARCSRPWLSHSWARPYMCSPLTLTLRAAELLANHAAAKAISSAPLHTGPGSGAAAAAADGAPPAAPVAAAQSKHLKEQPLRWRHRGYCPDCVKACCFPLSGITSWCGWETAMIDVMISAVPSWVVAYIWMMRGTHRKVQAEDSTLHFPPGRSWLIFLPSLLFIAHSVVWTVERLSTEWVQNGQNAIAISCRSHKPSWGLLLKMAPSFMICTRLRIVDLRSGTGVGGSRT